MNKQEGQTNKTHRCRQQFGGYQMAGGQLVQGKRGQIYGDRRGSDFGWWALNAVYRSCIIEVHT